MALFRARGHVGRVVRVRSLPISLSTSRRPSARIRWSSAPRSWPWTRPSTTSALASLVIGILNSLGTPSGLFGHCWVLVKLLLTAFATTVLLFEIRTVESGAAAAAAGRDPTQLASTLLHSIGGAVVRLVVLVLSTVKPRGITRYGWRMQMRASRM